MAAGREPAPRTEGAARPRRSLGSSLLPLKDLNPTRTTPVVTIALILANLAVWILYELPTGLESAVLELGYQPCELEGSCPVTGRDWPATLFTSMFMHGSWLHLAGNMLFLWVFGNNVEDALGHARYLVFYLAGGLAATFAQTAVTLGLGDDVEARIPQVGASGAIAAVLGAYLVLHPRALVLTWIFPIFLFPIPAIFFLVGWFVFQLVDGTASLTTPEVGGGVAFFAHVGGFAFGFLTIRAFRAGRPRAALR